jgi:hypothetical protein
MAWEGLSDIMSPRSSAYRNQNVLRDMSVMDTARADHGRYNGDDNNCDVGMHPRIVENCRPRYFVEQFSTRSWPQ